MLSSTLNAEMLKKPSKRQIKSLIHKMVLKSRNTEFTGVYADYLGIKCKKVVINNINILKIGKVFSSYYRRSGDYAGSSFKVKFTINGSCQLSAPYRINEDEYSRYLYKKKRSNKKLTPVMPLDLSGKIPFRKNVPFEVNIYADDYGDWVASDGISTFRKEDSIASEQTKNYLKKLFYRHNKSKVVEWKREQKRAKNRLSDEATRGFNVMKYDRLYTKEFQQLLALQSKRIKEFMGKTYWQVSHTRDHAKRDLVMREFLNQMRLNTKRR